MQSSRTTLPTTNTVESRVESRGRSVVASEVIAPAAITLLAFALRLYQNDVAGLWFDDTHSVHMARLGLAQLLTEVSEDIHPPLYFIVLGWWMRFAGSSEFALRYFTLLTALPTVPLLFVLGRRIAGARLGLAVAATATLSPLLIYYSQEVRMYAPSLSLTTAACFFAWRAITGEPPRRWVIPYVLCAAAAGYMHLFNLAVVPTLNIAYTALALPPAVWAARKGRDTWGAGKETLGGDKAQPHPSSRSMLWWLGAQVAIGAILLPWLPVLQRKDLVGASTAWQPLEELAKALQYLWTSFTVGVSPAPGGQYPLTLAAWGVVALGLVGPLVLGGRRLVPPGAGKAALLGGLWLGVCFALVYLGLAGRREAAPRYLMVAYPGFALLVGTGLSLFSRVRWAMLAGLGLLALAFGAPLADYYRDPQLMRPDDRAAIHRLDAMAQPGDAGVFIAHYQMVSYEYYGRGGIPIVAIPPSELANQRADEPGVKASVEKALADLAAQYDRIWVLYWTEYFTDPDSIVEKWLDNNLVRFHQSVYNGWIRVKGYESRPAAEIVFGDAIRLQGYEITPLPLQAGEPATVKLTWRVVGKPQKDYQVFVHVVDRDYNFIGQHDGPPDGGKLPTTAWVPGMRIVDSHEFQVAPDAASGEYFVRVGFYALDDMQRLPTQSADHLLLTKVKVQGKER